MGEDLQRAALHERVENDFRHHPPRDGQAEVYGQIRSEARALAHLLVSICPLGRELSTALTKLEECVMHANAGIARGGGA